MIVSVFLLFPYLASQTIFLGIDMFQEYNEVASLAPSAFIVGLTLVQVPTSAGYLHVPYVFDSVVQALVLYQSIKAVSKVTS